MQQFIQIEMTNPLYQQERELRNLILLRPIGVPDYGWEMRDEDSLHFVCVEESKVVACLIVYLESSNRGQLMQMAVDKSYQGKGIGRSLVTFALQKCAEQALKEIFCHARETVTGFYDSLGFEAYDEPFLEAGIKHQNMRIFLSKKMLNK